MTRKPSTTPPPRLFELRRAHYSGFADYDPEEPVLRSAWAFFTEQPQAQWYEGNGFVLGLYALTEEPAAVWAFGYLETEPDVDPTAFAAEWSALRAAVPGPWVGPLLGSTFLPYRVVTDDSGAPYFPGEWRTRPEYAALLEAQGPSKTIHYRSAERSHFQNVIDVSQPFLDRWKAEGFALDPMNPSDPAQMEVLHEVIDRIFSGNFGYQRLSPAQFGRWTASLSDLHRGSPILHWVCLGAQRVGFTYLFALPDGTVVFKTIGLLPEHQAQGLGNAVAGALHHMAKDRRAPRCIYALVHTENRVNRMPDPDIHLIRSYAAYFFAPVARD